MSILELVAERWAWSGLQPVELVVANDFANQIIKDADDRFWRLCPEDVYCRVVAESIEQYNRLIQDPQFLEDWHVIGFVSEAKQQLGPLEPGEAFALRVPGILGGDYLGKNVCKAAVSTIIASAGRLGEQIHNLPEGAKVDFDAAAYLRDEDASQ